MKLENLTNQRQNITDLSKKGIEVFKSCEKDVHKARKKEFSISLNELISSFLTLYKLLDTDMLGHSNRVTYIALNIAKELKLSNKEITNLVQACFFHDIGGFYANKLDEYNIICRPKHAEIGYYYLKTFEPLAHIAPIVRCHHVNWDYGKGAKCNGDQVPLSSHIIKLAGSIDYYLDIRKDSLMQREEVCRKVRQQTNNIFMPEVVDAFLQVCSEEKFWINIDCRGITSNMHNSVFNSPDIDSIKLDLDGLMDLAKFYSRILDFRSRYTAIHSRGVAYCAKALAEAIGMTEQECKMIEIAGYLHDLGKLGIPVEIIEKPGKLDDNEYNIMKTHSFYTHSVLKNIPQLETVNTWASLHHERLDGQGYPFNYKSEDIPLGSRIIAVADVFTALKEARSYREGMNSKQAMDIIRKMVEECALDRNVVEVLINNFNYIDLSRREAQKLASQEYEKFIADIESVTINLRSQLN